MTDLERRALLGDKQAQEECTRQGILLPCPICKNEKPVKGICQSFEYVQCTNCGLYIRICGVNRWLSAVSRWNTRPAPPIGRCKDCANACPGTYGPVCVIHGCNTDDDAWCNEFEPKETADDL